MNKSELLRFAKGGTPPPPAVLVVMMLNETTGSPEIQNSYILAEGGESWCIVVCQTKAAYDATDSTAYKELFAGEHERLTGQREGSQVHFIKVITESEASAIEMLLAGEDITSEHRPF